MTSLERRRPLTPRGGQLRPPLSIPRLSHGPPDAPADEGLCRRGRLTGAGEDAHLDLLDNWGAAGVDMRGIALSEDHQIRHDAAHITLRDLGSVGLEWNEESYNKAAPVAISPEPATEIGEVLKLLRQHRDPADRVEMSEPS